MNSLTSLILPSLIGLIAGINHGIISHRVDLPFSLPEQVIQTLDPQDFSQD